METLSASHIPESEVAAFRRFSDGLQRVHAPSGDEEMQYFKILVYASWLLQRSLAQQCKITGIVELAKFSVYDQRNQRLVEKNLKLLRDQQAARRARQAEDLEEARHLAAENPKAPPEPPYQAYDPLADGFVC